MKARKPRSTAKPATPTGGTLTHFDRHGQAHMVDVGAKDETHRVAPVTRGVRNSLVAWFMKAG